MVTKEIQGSWGPCVFQQWDVKILAPDLWGEFVILDLALHSLLGEQRELVEAHTQKPASWLQNQVLLAHRKLEKNRD